MRIGKRNVAGRKRIAGLFAFVLASVVGVSVYAFTASNTVPAHSAGAGAGEVSGYVIKSPTSYTFSPDGLTMTAVKFNLNKAATDVQVALSKGNPVKGNWKDCGASEGVEFEVKCTFAAPVPDAEGEKLSVAAVSSGIVVIE
jgi:hypothetical protein